MTKFRPCIDLHEGRVKQIVGGSLRDDGDGPTENFVAEAGPAEFARRFREDQLEGGHVIQLGPGNEEAAREALGAWPGGLQLGGGIHPGNAGEWLDLGASHVIVTSWLFEGGVHFSEDRLRELSGRIGADRLIIDLSCRRRGEGWVVATNRWQTLTELELGPRLLERLAPHCAEFLIHAADVEGLCGGIDEELVEVLGRFDGRPVTYAGGARSLEDLARVDRLSHGRVDLTIGSALDLYGGHGVRYEEAVAWNRREASGISRRAGPPAP